ncbi:unnamed protein product [Larinioides sclopetarius]|uniref:SWIM-type domain-containing protein n=1 Tax=Larinioides sclopetarius TaxID=280406 RepID=A0AAV1ZKV4_9ARAC
MYRGVVSNFNCASFLKLSHTRVIVLDDYDDYISMNSKSTIVNMQSSSSDNFFKSGKSTNELVLRLGQNEYETINILISNADSKSRIPQMNPFNVQTFIKEKVNRHMDIQSMKYTRQGKILFSTQDPVCAAQLLSLDSVVHTSVTTNGQHSATSKACPFYIKEQNILELKCRHHLATSEARRVYNQSSKSNYATAVKATHPVVITEDQISEKIESMMQKRNEKIDSLIQTLYAKMEQQFSMLVGKFEQLVESLFQHITALHNIGGESLSPSRKKKALDKLRKAYSIPMQLDANAFS